MENIGMLDWWENVLKAIAAWDGSEEMLNNQVKFEGSEPTTLRSLFNKVTDYIVYHYVTKKEEGGIEIEGLTQPAILDPKKNFFEIQIVTKEGVKTKKIMERFCAAGNFSKDQLLTLLDTELLANNICLIHTPTHQVRISYNKSSDKWLVYDPSYPIDALHPKFNDVHEVLKELAQRLHGKTTFAIDLIAMGHHSETNTKKHEQIAEFTRRYHAIIAEEQYIDLLKNNGMIVLIKYQPNVLSQLIKKAADEKYTERKDLIHKISIEILTTLKKNQTTNVSAMINYAPNCFIELLSLAENEKNQELQSELVTAIIKGLLHRDKKGKTALEILFKKYEKIPHPLSKWLAESSLPLPKLTLDDKEPNIYVKSAVDWLYKSIKDIKKAHLQIAHDIPGDRIFTTSPKYQFNFESLLIKCNRLAELHSPSSSLNFLEMINFLEEDFDKALKEWQLNHPTDNFIDFTRKDLHAQYLKAVGNLLKVSYESYFNSDESTLLPSDDNQMERFKLLSQLDIEHKLYALPTKSSFNP